MRVISAPVTLPVECTGNHARYSRAAVALHWLSATLIVTLLGLGYWMVGVPRHVPLRGTLFGLHKSLGLLALGLVCLRLGWRQFHPPPPLSTDVPGWQIALARATHIALYVALFAQPAAGYAASALSPFGVSFFGLPLPSLRSVHSVARELLIAAHHAGAVVLLSLLGIHLLGVVKGLVTGPRDALRRMSW